MLKSLSGNEINCKVQVEEPYNSETIGQIQFNKVILTSNVVKEPFQLPN